MNKPRVFAVIYESIDEPLAERTAFIKRLMGHLVVVLLVVGGSLALGTIGFNVLGGLDWLDALLNAAMMLTTMGPINTLDTPAGKLFMIFFAFYSQLVFIVAVGVLFAPVVHRIMHSFHMGQDSDKR
jgi:hypothetical protein